VRHLHVHIKPTFWGFRGSSVITFLTCVMNFQTRWCPKTEIKGWLMWSPCRLYTLVNSSPISNFEPPDRFSQNKCYEVYTIGGHSTGVLSRCLRSVMANARICEVSPTRPPLTLGSWDDLCYWIWEICDILRRSIFLWNLIWQSGGHAMPLCSFRCDRGY
jgi:hypothetical protein